MGRGKEVGRWKRGVEGKRRRKKGIGEVGEGDRSGGRRKEEGKWSRGILRKEEKDREG